MFTLVDGFQWAATLVGEQLIRHTGAATTVLTQSDSGIIKTVHYPERTSAAIKLREDYVDERATLSRNSAAEIC